MTIFNLYDFNASIGAAIEAFVSITEVFVFNFDCIQRLQSCNEILMIVCQVGIQKR